MSRRGRRGGRLDVLHQSLVEAFEAGTHLPEGSAITIAKQRASDVGKAAVIGLDASGGYDQVGVEVVESRVVLEDPT